MNEKSTEKAVAVKTEENQQQDKMTIYDYEQKYVKRQNVKSAKILLRVIIAALGIFLFACLFFVSCAFTKLTNTPAMQRAEYA